VPVFDVSDGRRDGERDVNDVLIHCVFRNDGLRHEDLVGLVKRCCRKLSKAKNGTAAAATALQTTVDDGSVLLVKVIGVLVGVIVNSVRDVGSENRGLSCLKIVSELLSCVTEDGDGDSDLRKAQAAAASVHFGDSTDDNALLRQKIEWADVSSESILKSSKKQKVTRNTDEQLVRIYPAIPTLIMAFDRQHKFVGPVIELFGLVERLLSGGKNRPSMGLSLSSLRTGSNGLVRFKLSSSEEISPYAVVATESAKAKQLSIEALSDLVERVTDLIEEIASALDVLISPDEDFNTHGVSGNGDDNDDDDDDDDDDDGDDDDDDDDEDDVAWEDGDENGNKNKNSVKDDDEDDIIEAKELAARSMKSMLNSGINREGDGTSIKIDLSFGKKTSRKEEDADAFLIAILRENSTALRKGVVKLALQDVLSVGERIVMKKGEETLKRVEEVIGE